jgi:tRNA(Ile)-lysidine synthase TilS/MesJ
MKTKREIEKSIIKKFRKEIWSKFVKAINEFQLVNENDVIAICISGGKDSMLLAKCFDELKRHGLINFDVKYILMDPGYSKEHLDLIKNNCELLGINLNIFESKIFEILEKHVTESPCYMCARMRRGYLYNYAKELGCNKIALGHHFNDVIETIMLNLLYAGQYKTMMPKLKSTNFEGMELIRPLYYVKEDNIKMWAKYNELTFLNCACSVTKGNVDSKRKEIKELIAKLKETNENVDISIMRSAENVDMGSIIGYYKNDKYINFLDNYDNKEEDL